MAERKNFVRRIEDELTARMPGGDSVLIALFALLTLEFGQEVDAVMVHNACAVWRNRTDLGHRSLIPFPFLPPEEQETYTPYVDAIRAAVKADYAAMVLEHASSADEPEAVIDPGEGLLT